VSTTRRRFLQTTLGASAAISLDAALPSLWSNVAAAEANTDNVLVVVQLSGGNDGLNTIVPYKNSAYRKNRQNVAIAESDVLRIDDELGFHPSMQGCADLLEDGKLAILQGIGYPNPNRSHFESMDIWHSCRRKGSPRPEGWLGRYLDATASRNGDAPAMHLGEEKQPLALTSQKIRVPSVASLDRFRLDDKDNKQLRAAIGDLSSKQRSGSDLLGFIQTSTTSALAVSERIEQASAKYESGVEYPDNKLGEKLRTVAQLIDAGLKTRVYYMALDGFDTHSQQPAAHAALLGQLSSAASAFIGDINHHGHGDRVVLMSFSEFGRRVQENASEGTDHGAAGPMLLAGNKVTPGLTGDHPSLTDLVDGDLKFHTDFRQVYAAVLEKWLECQSKPILDGDFQPVDVFKA
jgi:uncharacterized protein (DUF1501 family)